MNPRSRRLIVTGVLVLLVLLAVAGAVSQARGAHAAPTATPGPAFTVADEHITENSGMTRDAGRQLFWVTNDSGETGRVYAVGPDGRTRGTLEFAAKPVDVEALAMAEGRLYVGDIGDNTASRDKVTVYHFDNPAPNDNRSGSYRAWDFAYPDGPHDAETLLVGPQGRLYIVTKEAQGGIYQAPRQLRTDAPNQLTRVGDAPAFVTDGAYLPDGRIALRTYTSVEVLDGKLYSPVARAGTPFQPQGESLAVSLDGKTLLLGSEGARMPVLRVPVPDQLLQEVTPGSPTPPPSPAPTPAAATPTPEASPSPSGDRRGTLFALAAAALASALAGVFVWTRPVGGRGAAPRAKGGTGATADATAPAPAAETAPAPATAVRQAPRRPAPPIGESPAGDPWRHLFVQSEPARPASGPAEAQGPVTPRRVVPRRALDDDAE